VADRLRARHPRHVTTLLDVIIATPPAGRGVVERFWQARRDEEMERGRERVRQAEEALRARSRPRAEP
jgi:hypothetical protein